MALKKSSAVERLGLYRRALKNNIRSGMYPIKGTANRRIAAHSLRTLKANAKKETGHTGRQLLGGAASKR